MGTRWYTKIYELMAHGIAIRLYIFEIPIEELQTVAADAKAELRAAFPECDSIRLTGNRIGCHFSAYQACDAPIVWAQEHRVDLEERGWKMARV